MNNKKKYFLIILFIVLLSQMSEGQVCDVVINVCSNELISSNPNDEDDFPDLVGTCVTINGARSVWYKIKIESGTELTFDIIPTVRSTDYDFVVYGPNPDCENVTDDIALRANYSGVTGPTGLSSSTINDCQDGGETPYSSAINVQVGEEYLVVVDRYSGTASTFDLIWGGDAVLDCSIVVGDLGEDQEVCEGTIVTLDGTTSSPTASNYQWFLDTGSGFSELTGETNSILIINNDVSGIYKVQVTDLDGSTDDDEVEINFYTVPVIVTPPSDINRCDEDRDGFLDFDLITDQTPEILNGLDPSLDSTDFEVLYFDNPSDANLNTTTAIIVNPYRVNTSENPTIYARIHNVDNTSCYTTVQFKLKVTDIPTPSQPTEYRVCDDTTSAGGNTDGVSGFLLNTKDAEILTGITNPGDYNISYHTDPLDAQTSSTANAIPKDIDYEVTGSQTVFVRVENIANTDCYAISDDTTGSTFTSFELIVDATPVIVTPPSDINRCDEDRVGFLNFDLIIDQTPEILNGLDLSLDSTDFEVLYFDNPSDADLNTTVAIIVNPYRVNTSDNPTIYARIHNVDNISCYTIVQFKLKVTDTPTPT
ncbi:hypothetical protein OAB80_03540, partial [Flavobacteriaceae bacterium]|nr:hypothetical protein [Flavobacteriaceae bacterium]